MLEIDCIPSHERDYRAPTRHEVALAPPADETKIAPKLTATQRARARRLSGFADHARSAFALAANDAVMRVLEGR